MSSERVPVDASAIWPSDVDEDEGVVVDWFVGEGTSVEQGETICIVQVEKVDVDVPAPASGVLVEVLRAEDDEIERGETLAWIEPA